MPLSWRVDVWEMFPAAAVTYRAWDVLFERRGGEGRGDISLRKTVYIVYIVYSIWFW